MTAALLPAQSHHEIFQDYVQRGLLHQSTRDGLTIYTYTTRCASDGAWDEITTQARGLILDAEGNIVARPFAKFWNLGESHCPALPEGAYEVTEKLDGSLGIWFWHQGTWRVATRGSFANVFTEYAQQFAPLFTNAPRDYTVLTEIQMPPEADGLRRAVPGTPGLILLSMRHTQTGAEPTRAALQALWDVPLALPTQHHTPIQELLLHATTHTGVEGWVVRYFDDPCTPTRAKIKTAWYLRLARQINNLTPARVADLEAEDPTGSWVGLFFPEELAEEARTLRALVHQRVAVKLAHCHAYVETYGSLPRKAFAHQVLAEHPHDAAVLFLLFDHRGEAAHQKVLRADPDVRGPL